MKTKFIVLIGFLIPSVSILAQNNSKVSDTSSIDKVIAWIDDISTPGVSITDDSLYLSDEVQKIMSDSFYRNSIYPTIYTWQPVTKFIKDQDLKPAFWFMINLYPVSKKDKDLVLRSILAYDGLFDMTKILPAVFGTYSLLDPTVGGVKDNHSEITSPHILEKKLQSVKEILYYVEKNRTLKQK